MKGAGALRRIRARREQRQAERSARRARRPQVPLPRISTPAEFVEAVTRLRAREHVMIDEHGNVATVEVDPDRFAAAIAKFDAHPHDDAGADDDDELDEIDNAAEIDADEHDGSLAGTDDDCPICRALRESAIGPPRRGWSLDG